MGYLLLIGAIYWSWHLFQRRHLRGKRFLRHSWPIIILLLLSLGAFNLNSTAATKPKTVTKTKIVKKTHHITVKNDTKLAALIAANQRSATSLKKTAQKLTSRKTTIDHQKAQNKADGATKTTAATTTRTSGNPTNTALANQQYQGHPTVTINANNPAFSTADLTTRNGAWQKYGDLDQLNRPTIADALLNQSLMPTTKRTALTVDPTGWHNKRIASGWLYNRSHLIGYQLTGQNNNPKNLITGTRSLNDPEMVTYENQVADYLHASPDHYVRYEVKPIFKADNLLASGVQMRAQSIDSSAVSFNVYIFNVQTGMTLNYQTGTSRVAN
ncbi:hydroxyacid dehydrogenase [Lactobacillus sp. CBA3605]|uniref:DNA/RNA non-specific endonuclease n=1 Tax=Lactobacillus sp. CBA3605 TaxID=2099788 RepID=UPI000CFB3CDC|nr:DNA/RNA non-specific endonuclease [Lactobacillus sp. CBA3605]AVK61906.1 hydroxyacid dehydrogenase [Lactobacillus sp. CBA3605]